MLFVSTDYFSSPFWVTTTEELFGFFGGFMVITWFLVIIHNFFLFWYECFFQQMQSLNSCGKLSQLGSSSPPRDHTSLNLSNDKLNLLCMSKIQIGWMHSPTLLCLLDLILQLEIWEFPYSVVFYLLDILQHFISENFLISQRLFPPLCFLFEIPSFPYFICWFLFCSWDLRSLPY